jgi:hypothetical protein
MTRTTIHTSDGDTYYRAGRLRITARRIILTALTAGALIFISAAIIGLTESHPHPITRTQDDTASFNDGVNTELQDLQQIARRPAHTRINSDGSKISDPNGIAIIRECLSDTSLSVNELGACLDQPAN